MKKYFNVNLEFNHSRLEELVREYAEDKSKKGYCCFVDLNSLVHAHKHKDFKKVLNNAFVNSCDGSYIAMSASKIHKENLQQYIGPDFFEKFIFKPGKHVILGSTLEVFNKIIERVEHHGGDKEKINYLSLPFKSLEEFDYKSIAEAINTIEPNYIWVSLGAPKQEYFMNKLLPFINKGVLLGVGAALNYFSGEIKDIPAWVKKINLVWVFRAVNEPKKQLKRIKVALSTLPKILKDEKERLKY